MMQGIGYPLLISAMSRFTSGLDDLAPMKYPRSVGEDSCALRRYFRCAGCIGIKTIGIIAPTTLPSPCTSRDVAGS
jgi:hypothetical protein